MTAKGDPITAKRALDAGLIDRLAGEDSLEADAIALARACAGKPLPRASQTHAPPDPAAATAHPTGPRDRFRGRSAAPGVGEERVGHLGCSVARYKQKQQTKK